MKGLLDQLLEHAAQYHHLSSLIFVHIGILLAVQDSGRGAMCPDVVMPHLDKALPSSTFDMWDDAIEGPVSLGIAEAACVPLWTILIHVVCPILVALPIVNWAMPGCTFFFPFLMPSSFTL